MPIPQFWGPRPLTMSLGGTNCAGVDDQYRRREDPPTTAYQTPASCADLPRHASTPRETRAGRRRGRCEHAASRNRGCACGFMAHPRQPASKDDGRNSARLGCGVHLPHHHAQRLIVQRSSSQRGTGPPRFRPPCTSTRKTHPRPAPRLQTFTGSVVAMLNRLFPSRAMLLLLHGPQARGRVDEQFL